ncbi:hypothetical protein C2G38_2229455 [Gigaspora rosea]|uniref:Uncharacterized protein n=1 Tax=Gigaspora rosea TaxID=44941 RepID=A0A397TUN2_9GLOM|nr:hypothetical protein C2G38_2229455 [Gigaspora rosea]
MDFNLEERQCAVIVCAKASNQPIKKVTEFILEKAQQNKTLPAYLKVSDIIYTKDYPGTAVDTQDDVSERNLALYLDSTGTGDSTINALAELGIISTSQTVWRNETSTPTHLITILLNPINATLPIPINFNSTSIHNPNQISENEEETIEALTVHSYDLWLKERMNDRSLNNIILVDLIKNNLYSTVLTIIWRVCLLLGKWILCKNISIWVLGVNIQPWKINLLLKVTRRGWLRILDNVKKKFGLSEDLEYLTLKALLDNLRFSRYNYNKVPLIFINHPILEILKAHLPKFSDAPVELFHSLLRRTTQKHDIAEHLQHQAHFINFLRCEKWLEELFEHQSTWKKYPLSHRNLNSCIQKSSISNISMPAIGIIANSCHLPLGFSTLQKFNQYILCDYPLCTKADMNVFTNLLSPNLKILACGHKYHVECLNEIDQKCLPCLEFLQNEIKANADQLLECLLDLNNKKKAKNKKKAEHTQVQKSRMEELKDEIAEDDELIIPRGIGKTEVDDLLQKLKGLQ